MRLSGADVRVFPLSHTKAASRIRTPLTELAVKTVMLLILALL